jgi:iron(III) transport system substrate-binding protein
MTDKPMETGLQRRQLLLAGGGLAAVASLGLPAQAQERLAAARREGRVLLFSGQSADLLARLKQGFEARFTGVTLETHRADLSPLIQRFVTETAASRPSADVLDLVERRSVEMAERNLAAPYVSPEAETLPADARQADGLWSNYALHLGSFAYNTQRVATPPTSWEDLLDPRWRGRIGMQNPIQGGGAAIWVITMFEAWGEARWTDYMTRLAAQNLRMGNYFQVQDMLAGGEVDIQVAAYPNFVEPFVRRTGARMSWGVPNPVMRTFNTLTVSRNATNPNAARLLVDYILSAEGQSLLADLNILPVRVASRPAAYARLEGATFADQAWRLEAERPDWFRTRIREIFSPR